MRDPYEILGVQKNATPAAVKSAFRRLAKKLHPDANKKDESPDKEKKPGDKNDEKAEKKEEKPPKPVEIDLDDFEQRLVVLPPKV